MFFISSPKLINLTVTNAVYPIIALTQRAGLKTEYRKRVLILTPSLFYLSARNVSFLNNKINAAIVIIIVNNPK